MSPGAFVRAVRESRSDQPRPTDVATPESRRYTEEGWAAAFRRVAHPDAADRRLYDAGRWFAARFASVRAAQPATALATGRSSAAWEDGIRLTVGLANAIAVAAASDSWVAHDAAAALPGVWGALSDVAAGAPQAAPQALWRDPANVAERMTSAARRVVAIYATAVPRFDPPRAADRADRAAGAAALDHVRRSLDLGDRYELYEELWQRCVWLGWYVEVEPDGDLVRPSEPDDGAPDEAELSVARFRAASLLVGQALAAARTWAGLPDAERARYLRANRGVTRATRTGGEVELHLGPLHDDPATVPAYYAELAHAEDRAHPGELDAERVALGGFSVRQLLLTWRVLASTAAALEAEYPRAVLESGADAWQADDVRAFAPPIRTSVLTSAVQDALGIAPDRAAAAVRHFVGTRAVRDEIWHRPIVPAGGDHVLLLTQALLTVNLPWLVEHWLRAAGMKLSKRGIPAERRARAAIVKAAGAGGIGRVRESAWKPVLPEGAYEEIDLLVRVGGTLLVGDVKSSIHPVRASEVRNYLDLLQEGADKVRRKAGFVEQHLAALAATEPILADPALPQIEQVLPVVVSTIPLGAGLWFNATPVVDPDLLAAYLRGPAVSLLTANTSGGGRRAERTVTLYDDAGTAASELRAYLLNPPQVAVLFEALAARRVPIEQNGSRWVHLLDQYVDLPLAVSVDDTAGVAVPDPPR